ncbi:MAG: hypothetical protein V9E85_05790 [Candidatus Nanopelagicales bacterium]
MTAAKQRDTVGGFALYVVAVVAGVIAGIVGTAFREALVLANQFRLDVVAYFHQWPLIGWVVPVGAAAIAVASREVHRRAGSGIGWQRRSTYRGPSASAGDERSAESGSGEVHRWRARYWVRSGARS